METEKVDINQKIAEIKKRILLAGMYLQENSLKTSLRKEYFLITFYGPHFGPYRRSKDRQFG